MREVLRGLSAYTRQLSKSTVSTTDDAIAAAILVGDPPERGSRRQVNFRLAPDERPAR